MRTKRSSPDAGCRPGCVSRIGWPHAVQDARYDPGTVIQFANAELGLQLALDQQVPVLGSYLEGPCATPKAFSSSWRETVPS